jgi:thioesterase domain-containing protein
METGALISLLRERDVKLSVDSGRLKLSAPPGVLDEDLRAILASRKEDILAVLRRAEDLKSQTGALVPVKPEGTLPPIFGVSGFRDDAYYFVALARHLDADQPLFSVEPKGVDGTATLDTMEELAAYQIEHIRRFRPNGPYLLAGHCSGGILAFEIARQLTAAGQDVPLVAMIGTPGVESFDRFPMVWLRARRHFVGLFTGSLEDRKRYVKNRLERRRMAASSAVSPQELAARARQMEEVTATVRSYKPGYYAGHIDLFVTSDEPRQADPWRKLARDVREHDLTAFGRDELLLGAHVAKLAAPFTKTLKSWPQKSGTYSADRRS